MAIMKFNPRTAMRLFGLVVATAALSWQVSDAPDLAVVDGLRLSSLLRNPSQTTAEMLKTETEKVTAISESDTKIIEQKVRKALEKGGFTVATDNEWPSIEEINDKYKEVSLEYTQGKKKNEPFLELFYGYNDLRDHYEDFYRKKMLVREQPSAGPASDAEAALEAYRDANDAGLKLNELGKKLRDMDIDVDEYFWARHNDLSNKLTAALDKFKQLCEGNGLSEADKSKYLTKFHNLGQVAEDKLQAKETEPQGGDTDKVEGYEGEDVNSPHSTLASSGAQAKHTKSLSLTKHLLAATSLKSASRNLLDRSRSRKAK